jgi:hypothetical protein
MRTVSSRSFRTQQDRLSDAEVRQHIEVAYAALNQTLATAARQPGFTSDFAHEGKPRYTLTLDDSSLTGGSGTLADARTGYVYDVRICFGVRAEVQLKREFFEDVTDTQVAVKKNSLPCLSRPFLEFLRDLKNPREAGRWSFGPADDTRLAMTA